MDTYEIRIRAVDAAKWATGLTANPAEDRQSYLDFVGPGESAAMQGSMATMSGCGLTVAGIWRAIGVVHPKLSAPYKPGEGISRLITVARSTNAWRPFTASELPQAGDMVLVGDNTAANGVEHVYTILDQVETDITLFRTVDGGQIENGFQIIKEKQHRWEGQMDFGLASTDPGGKASKGRKIIGWVDVPSLPIR
jgi:hypothetical protein